MANEEHLKIIKQGVKAWNQWRKKNPKIRPDLSGADLSGADLSGADLTKANLTKANLTWAILIKANLTKANLNGANLYKANLNGANLYKANLSGAILSGADLTKANLTWAILIKANLSGAIRVDLEGAIYDEQPHVRVREGYKEKTYTFSVSVNSFIDLTVSENISPENLSKLLSALNQLHFNLSGQYLEIDSIKIGLPDYIVDSSEAWKAGS